MRTHILLILIVFVIALGATEAEAQWILGRGDSTSDINLPKTNIDLKSMSLLDPDRFSMKQQSIVSFSSSSMSGGNLIGMYVNTMEYRFNMPLTMRMKVAYRNNMGNLVGNKSATGGNPGVDTGSVFIPAFDMVYTPWDNLSISFHYRDYSGLTESGYGYMGSRYSFSPYARYYSDPFGLYR